MVPLLQGAFLRMPTCYSDGIDTRVVLLRRRTVSESMKIKSTDSGEMEDLDHRRSRVRLRRAAHGLDGEPDALGGVEVAITEEPRP